MADREMNGREQLEYHILTWLSEDERPSIQDRAGMITSVIMEALDSWIEEHQPQEEEIKVGDRVKMVAPNPDEEEEDGPLLPAYGVVSGYHMGLADPHYLVNFEKEFDQQHNGLRQAEDDHGNLVEVNHGWFCHRDVLEKV